MIHPALSGRRLGLNVTSHDPINPCPTGKLIHKTYTFGANFYVIYTLTPYRKGYHELSEAANVWISDSYQGAVREAVHLSRPLPERDEEQPFIPGAQGQGRIA